MTREQLFEQINKKQSFLCVGLDTDINKIPSHLKKEKDPIFAFNKQIIDATHQYAVAYKPNLAFYEAHGAAGWEALQKTVAYIPDEIFTIADAKRGDIGNTSTMYARAFFENLGFDSITVAPYMGEDSISPYLEFEGKWAIVLGATSNKGSIDFQDLMLERSSQKLYEKVIKKSSEWGTPENMMYVVGATRPEVLMKVRTLLPHHFFLIPGVGAQGGNLEAVCKYGMNSHGGILVNSSRGIIYADDSKGFAQAAGAKAQEMQQTMARFLK